MQKVHFEMPDDIHRKLKMLAARKKTTMTALMIEAATKAVGNEGERK